MRLLKRLHFRIRAIVKGSAIAERHEQLVEFVIVPSATQNPDSDLTGLYLFMGMAGIPPGEFSLTSLGTKIPGQDSLIRW
jgi:hypothetical protein